MARPSRRGNTAKSKGRTKKLRRKKQELNSDPERQIIREKINERMRDEGHPGWSGPAHESW